MTEIRWHGRGGQGSFTASKLLGVSVALYGGSMPSPFPPLGLSEEAPLSWPLPGLTVRRFTTAAKSENVILLWFWMKPFLVKAF